MLNIYICIYRTESLTKWAINCIVNQKQKLYPQNKSNKHLIVVERSKVEVECVAGKLKLCSCCLCSFMNKPKAALNGSVRAITNTTAAVYCRESFYSRNTLTTFNDWILLSEKRKAKAKFVGEKVSGKQEPLIVSI